MFSISRRSAFTLVELLVVIAIIGVLVAMFLPAIGEARDTARFLGCVSSVRSCVLVEMTYLNDNRQWFQSFNYYGYDFDFTVYNQYLGGDASKLFQKGCPARFTKTEWSYGTNGSVRYWVPEDYPTSRPFYNTSHAARLDDVRRPEWTHIFADMVGGYYRYPNGSFFDTYLLGPRPPRAFRHEGKGIGVGYLDGHADFQRNRPSTPPGYAPSQSPIWNATWHYAFGCPTDGCFWHAYNSAKH